MHVRMPYVLIKELTYLLSSSLDINYVWCQAIFTRRDRQKDRRRRQLAINLDLRQRYPSRRVLGQFSLASLRGAKSITSFKWLR